MSDNPSRSAKIGSVALASRKGRPVSAVPCSPRLPDEPEDYVAWHDWAAAKSKTHRQEQCETCKLFHVWVDRHPWDRAEELEKLSIAALVKRVATHMGMGGAWGFEKLPKTTLIAMLEWLDLPSGEVLDAVEEEREACAKIALESGTGGELSQMIASKIRERGES